jgi:hypothetical protein
MNHSVAKLVTSVVPYCTEGARAIRLISRLIPSYSITSLSDGVDG